MNPLYRCSYARSWILLLLSFSWALGPSSEADFEDLINPNSQKIAAGFEGVPKRNLSERSGGLGYQSWSAKGAIPLATFRGQDSWYRAIRLSASPSFAYRRTLFTPMGRELALLHAAWGTTAVAIATNGEIYGLSLTPSLSEEDRTIGDPRLQIMAMAFGTDRLSDSVTLIYGILYSTTMSFNFPLPILGLTWKINPDWRLTTLFPVFTQLSFSASQSVKLSIFSKYSGSKARISNSNGTGQNAVPFSGRESVLSFKQTGLALGSKLGLEINSSWSLNAEAGLLVIRKALLEDDQSEFFSRDIDPAPYGALDLTLKW